MMTQNQQFPSLKTLFRESWVTTKAVIGRYFLWSIVGTASFMAIILSLALVVGLVVFILTTLSITLPEVAQVVIVLLVSLIFLALLYVAAVAFLTVSYKILADHPEKKGFDELVKLSWKKSGTFLLLFVAMIPFWGSIFAFLIPGIIIGFLLSFAGFGVMIKDRGAWASIKRSIVVWQTHPGQLFLKYTLVSLGLYVLATGISNLGNALELIPLQPLSAILQTVWFVILLIFSIILTVFAPVYAIKVFEAAESLTPETAKPRMWWVWLFSALGWLLLSVQILAVVLFFRSTYGQELLRDIQIKAEQEMGAKVNLATKLDEASAQQLAEESFVEINVRRVKAGNKPLLMDPQLCSYAQKLISLENIEENGSQVIKDTLDKDIESPAIFKEYFQGYYMVTYAIKYGVRSFDTPQSVVDFLAGGEESLMQRLVTDPEFKAACVVANPDYVLVLPVK